MKRPNINFSKQGLQEFFFRHGEKVFFGIACALIAFFFWLGFKTPAYQTTTPSAMLQTAGQAGEYINDTSNWDKVQEYRVADTRGPELIANADKLLDVSKLSFSQLSGTAVLTRQPRTDPNFLAAENLFTKFFRAQVVLAASNQTLSERFLTRGLTGLPNNEDIVFPPEFRYLLWTYRPEKHNVSVDRNRFVTTDVVYGTALIPHAQQIAEYESKFQFARGYDEIRDKPEYAFLEVQRKTKDTDWVSITAHVHEVTRKTAEPAADLSDKRYTVDNVTLKIPPFIGFDYRGFSMHPEVPPQKVLEDKKKEKQDPSDVTDDENVFGSGGTKPEDPGEPQEAKEDEENKDDEDVPYKLVRFYDLEDKKVGESYLYRVRVWMLDPNNPEAVSVAAAAVGAGPSLSRGGGAGGGGGAFAEGPPTGGGRGAGAGSGGAAAKREVKPLSETDLAFEARTRYKAGRDDFPADVVERFGATNADGDSLEIVSEENAKKLVPTEWAEAQNWVTVTKGFETFAAGPVRAPPVNRVGDRTFTTTEPEIEVVATSFQDDLGIGVPATAKLRAGSVMNFRTVTNVLHPITWEIKEVYESKDEKRGDKVGRKFVTDAVVLDILGGERQPFSKNKDVFYAPGEVLIMDRNGNFVLRNDIEDETTYRQANFVSEENMQALKDKKRGGDRDDEGDDGDSGR